MGLGDILKKVVKGAAKGAFSKGSRKRRRRGWGNSVASYLITALGAYVARQVMTRPSAPPERPRRPKATLKAIEPPPPATPPPPPPPPPTPADTRAMLVIRAMVAAANADHEIDEIERRRIFEKADFMGLSDADRRIVHAEFDRPLSIPAIAREVDGDATLGRQVYLACLLALDLDTPAERMFLERLAAALGMPPSEVQELHEQAEL